MGVKGKQLGWTPKYDLEYALSSFDEEVGYVLDADRKKTN